MYFQDSKACRCEATEMKKNMKTKALVVIDIQNDITKHYRDIVDNINAAVDWAVSEGMHIVYIKHNNITASTRTFKPGTRGEELVSELKVVSDNVFVKTKSNALTSEAFCSFIETNGIKIGRASCRERV